MTIFATRGARNDQINFVPAMWLLVMRPAQIRGQTMLFLTLPFLCTEEMHGKAVSTLMNPDLDTRFVHQDGVVPDQRRAIFWEWKSQPPH